MKKINHPSWFSHRQVDEANALADMGFKYVAATDAPEARFVVGTVGGWIFYTTFNGEVINGVCKNATYSWNVENLSDYRLRLGDGNWHSKKVRAIKEAFKAIPQQESAAATGQISLF